MAPTHFPGRSTLLAAAAASPDLPLGKDIITGQIHGGGSSSAIRC